MKRQRTEVRGQKTESGKREAYIGKREAERVKSRSLFTLYASRYFISHPSPFTLSALRHFILSPFTIYAFRFTAFYSLTPHLSPLISIRYSLFAVSLRRYIATSLFAICYSLLPPLNAQDFNALKSQFELGQPDRRKDAVEKMSQMKSPESFGILRAALIDPDNSVREAGLKGITAYLRNDYLKHILPLLDDSDAEVKDLARKIILSNKDDFTFQTLKTFVSTAKNETTLVYETLDLISSFEREEVIDYFKSISVENDNIRYAISRILHKFGKNKISLVILEKYLKDEIPEIRLEAARTISKIGYYPFIGKTLSLLLDRDEKIQKNIPSILKNLDGSDSLVYWIAALKMGSPKIRAFCVENICDIGEKDAFPMIFSMLDDPDKKVRTAAESNLQKLFDKKFIYYLITELNSKNPIRRKNAGALIKISEESTMFHFLISAIENESNKYVSEVLTEAMYSISSQDNLPEIKKAAMSKSPQTRIAALRCLEKISKIKYGESVEVLEIFVKKETDASVKKEVLKTMDKLVPAPYTLAFHFLEKHPDEIKFQAIEILSSRADTSAIPHLARAANDKNIEVSLRAKDAIEKIVKNEQDVVELSEHLKIQKKQMRLFILGVLKRFPSKKFAKNLEYIDYEKSDTEIRYSLIEVIRNLKMAEPHPFLMLALKDKNPEIRWMASKAINETQKTDVSDDILGALSDANPSVREEALKFMAKNPRFEHATKIIPLLGDTDISVRQNALLAIENIVNEEALKKIQTMLSDNDMSIRTLSAKIMGKANVRDAISSLRKMAEKDIYPECRKNAVKALFQMGDNDEKTIYIYFNLVKDSDSSVRDEAKSILDSILNKSHLPYILKALNDENWHSRNYALGIIPKLNLHEANPVLFNMAKFLNPRNRKENHEFLAVLSKLIDESDIPELEKLYVLNKPELKMWVIEQLKNLKSEASINLTVRALKEENPAYRQKAIESLIDIKNPRVLTALKYISANDPDPVLRKMAAAKLREGR